MPSRPASSDVDPSWLPRKRRADQRRLNVYLPADLSARMGKAEKRHPGISWSRVCQQAIADAIDAVLNSR